MSSPLDRVDMVKMMAETAIWAALILGVLLILLGNRGLPLLAALLVACVARVVQIEACEARRRLTRRPLEKRV